MLRKRWDKANETQLVEIDHTDSDELRLQKREAFVRLSEVWKDALGAGIEPDVLAQVALFTALGDLIATYGEDAVADFAERLPDRIVSGEFTIPAILN
jgi:hypothetical protein